jgi:hypothetical protein
MSLNLTHHAQSVCMATDAQGNEVAVKMLDRMEPMEQERLRREALTMRDVGHPCVAQIFGG